MRLYVDSSVVLRGLLNEDDALRGMGPADQVGSSDLLDIECRRVLQRERLEAHLDDREYAETLRHLDHVLERLFIIELGPAIKRRAAGSFPTIIGTLDAIHLASALAWHEAEPDSPVVLSSYDRQLTLCARAMGIRCREE
jgi:predicted nucleic acid-binding protein